jgi:hypothetical protein
VRLLLEPHGVILYKTRSLCRVLANVPSACTHSLKYRVQILRFSSAIKQSR